MKSNIIKIKLKLIQKEKSYEFFMNWPERFNSSEWITHPNKFRYSTVKFGLIGELFSVWEKLISLLRPIRFQAQMISFQVVSRLSSSVTTTTIKKKNSMTKSRVMFFGKYICYVYSVHSINLNHFPSIYDGWWKTCTWLHLMWTLQRWLDGWIGKHMDICASSFSEHLPECAQIWVLDIIRIKGDLNLLYFFLHAIIYQILACCLTILDLD